jgi:hypothetical protein
MHNKTKLYYDLLEITEKQEEIIAKLVNENVEKI